jgi:SAM-dependent methyltransferase
MQKPYHKFVFDIERRVFVGRFEEMYRQEDEQHFDSWEQENIWHPARQLAMTVLQRYNFSSILDFGCGKGFFCNMLSRKNNHVTGIDISTTALQKAAMRFPAITFIQGDDRFFVEQYTGKHELIITMEVLSYISDWKELIRSISEKTIYYLVTLYIPEDPIGFVKSFEELKEEVLKYFSIETELLINQQQLLLFCRTQNSPR